MYVCMYMIIFAHQILWGDPTPAPKPPLSLWGMVMGGGTLPQPVRCGTLRPVLRLPKYCTMPVCNIWLAECQGWSLALGNRVFHGDSGG